MTAAERPGWFNPLTSDCSSSARRDIDDVRTGDHKDWVAAMRLVDQLYGSLPAERMEAAEDLDSFTRYVGFVR